MDFKVGDMVWVEERKEERRQGKILEIYPCFILVWVYGRLSNTGWRECFLWHDVENGVVIRQRKRQTGKSYCSHLYPIQPVDTTYDGEERMSVLG